MTTNNLRRYLWIGAALLSIGILAIILNSTTPRSVTVEWSTASELNTAGFNLYRSQNKDGPFTRINTELIPASPDPLVGGSYVFTDTGLTAGWTYYYQLEEVDTNGAASPQGVVAVTTASSPSPAVLALAAGGVALLVALTWLIGHRK